MKAVFPILLLACALPSRSQLDHKLTSIFYSPKLEPRISWPIPGVKEILEFCGGVSAGDHVRSEPCIEPPGAKFVSDLDSIPFEFARKRETDYSSPPTYPVIWTFWVERDSSERFFARGVNRSFELVVDSVTDEGFHFSLFTDAVPSSIEAPTPAAGSPARWTFRPGEPGVWRIDGRWRRGPAGRPDSR